MITKWTVSNFKSIAKEISLDLAPLTIFAGPNSSGKSTVLQGMLLISQTLSNKVSSRSVVLNGALARLGQFDDLRSHGSEFDQITLGWECRPIEERQEDAWRRAFHLWDESRIVYEGRLEEISCKLSFDADPGSADRDILQLQPQLFLFHMSVLSRYADNTDRRSELTVTRSPLLPAKYAFVYGDKLDAYIPILGRELSYDINLDDETRKDVIGNLSDVVLWGCELQHFLPTRLVLLEDAIKSMAESLHREFQGDSWWLSDPCSAENREWVEQSFFLLKSHHENLSDGFPALLGAVGDAPIEVFFNRDMDELTPDDIQQFVQSMKARCSSEAELADVLRSRWPADRSRHSTIHKNLPTDLGAASYYLSDFFSDSVRYLGPLRDEPKPLYPLTTHGDPMDLGIKGEMTAAVLNLHRERIIRYIPSATFGRSTFDPTPVPRSLEAAVTDWLRYLGVAEKVDSVDKGKLGHELKVTLSGDGSRQDLTHVGVGVSQVLPILVMGLLADQDTTLIFEQPELHLHPMVQTRLGDFFLSISLAGKQCLIETHSEYLINRLRYRAAAEGTSSRVTDNLKIYFVEKLDGSSNFREVKVNEYGAILDWPEGFFDQSQFEAESILRAAAAKRKIRQGK